MQAVAKLAMAKQTDEQAAAQQIEKLGGKLALDDQHHVTKVDLSDLPITNDQLKPLAILSHLRTLTLWGPGVTSAGMEHC